ncbi:MAG: DUF4926 domain-containing protein [Chthoniobacter sp.]
MSTIKELDTVILTIDIPTHGLQRGDVGTAVLVHGDGEAFEVEFIGYDGHTVALITLERSAVRPLQSTDAWDAEVCDRIRAIDEGRVAGVAYEEVMRAAEKRLAP